MQNFFRLAKRGGWILGTVAVIGFIGWYVATRPPVPEGEVLARRGLHWHPELTIYVKGVKQEIPSGVGLGIVEQNVHTHDATGQVHLEFLGQVLKDNVKLGTFFKVWGKDMRFFGTNMKMTVNGEENTEYGNYVMHDKDKIELRYE